MKTPFRCRRLTAWLIGLAMLGMSSLASADPPARVARIATMSGAVSFNPAGDEEWVQASLNRPLTTGDRVWADARSRAELQVGGAAVRLGADTDLSILNLDDRIAQLQLTQGVLNVRVRRIAPDQTYEVDTPNLALTLRQPGAYRVEVDPDGNATMVFVREGQVEVYGEGASYVIDERQPYRFTGTDLRDYEYVSAPPFDEFDRWASDRDRYYERSASARYVSPEVIGYQDLDAHGTWRHEPDYGYVWMPTRVSAGWAPYREGHWAWIEPWGWTWVDDAPWGFAVSHYGRWVHLHDHWGWVPGPVHVRPYYAPALVAFIGGPNFSISISSGPVGGVAWFPLGPREVYRPAYAVSRTYFQNVNVSNTIVNTTVINNYYNNTNVTNVVYANQRVPGAVVAVPAQTFAQSKPVAREAVRVAPNQLVSRPVAIAPTVAPTERSVRGAAERGGKPPAKAIERTVVAREAPATRPRFEPTRGEGPDRGQPDADEARKRLAVAAPVRKPNVKVIEQKADERPRAAPPPAAKGARPDTKGDEARGRPDQREADQARGRPDQGEADQARGRPDQREADQARGRPDQREGDQARERPDPRERDQARGRPDQRDADQGRGRDDDRKGPPSRDAAGAPGGPQSPRADTEAPRKDEKRDKPDTASPPRSPEQRAQPDERGRRAQDERPMVPTPPARAERPAPVPRPPTARGGEQSDRADPRERDQRDRPDPRAERREKSEPRERPDARPQPAPRSSTPMPPQAERPAPLPQPPEPRAKRDQSNRAEPPAPRPSPQVRTSPAPDEPRARVEAPRRPEPPHAAAEPPRRPEPQPPRAAAEAPRRPAPQPSPPVARPQEPARPIAEAQPRPAPRATPPEQERRAPQGRQKKDERDDNKK